MGLKNMYYMVKHARHAQQITDIYNFINSHTAKRCLYCDMELGDAMNIPVIEFLDHLKQKHSNKVEQKKIEKMIKIFS